MTATQTAHAVEVPVSDDGGQLWLKHEQLDDGIMQTMFVHETDGAAYARVLIEADGSYRISPTVQLIEGFTPDASWKAVYVADVDPATIIERFLAAR